MLNEITEFARETAAGAGKILINGFRTKKVVVSQKSRTNLVTNIDTASEEFIFTKISERFPDHSIIAEEGNIKELKGEFIWYVDPLDGTNNYAHELPYFAVSIGVYSRDQKKVVSGVIFDPYHNEMFTGTINQGAELNGNKITVSETGDLGLSIISTGFPYEKEDPEKNNLREFNRFLPKVRGFRRMGSAALDLSFVACGRLDGYWEPLLFPWDMAAGSLIVEEAGGKITKYNGNRFDPEYPQIIASNGKIHNKIVEILTGN